MAGTISLISTIGNTRMPDLWYDIWEKWENAEMAQNPCGSNNGGTSRTC